MIIRRTKQRAELKNVPIDGFDMFLLNLLQDGLALTQLVEIAPRPAIETVSHVLHLTQLGLLQLDFETFDEQLLFARLVEERCEALDYATTGRPPARRPPSQAHMAPVVSSTETKRQLPPIHGLGVEETTGVRMRPSLPESEGTTGIRARPSAQGELVTQRAKVSGLSGHPAQAQTGELITQRAKVALRK